MVAALIRRPSEAEVHRRERTDCASVQVRLAETDVVVEDPAPAPRVIRKALSPAPQATCLCALSARSVRSSRATSWGRAFVRSGSSGRRPCSLPEDASDADDLEASRRPSPGRGETRASGDAARELAESVWATSGGSIRGGVVIALMPHQALRREAARRLLRLQGFVSWMSPGEVHGHQRQTVVVKTTAPQTSPIREGPRSESAVAGATLREVRGRTSRRWRHPGALPRRVAACNPRANRGPRPVARWAFPWCGCSSAT